MMNTWPWHTHAEWTSTVQASHRGIYIWLFWLLNDHSGSQKCHNKAYNSLKSIKPFFSMRLIWRDTLYSQSMWEEACCWFVVLLHSEKMLRMVYSVMRVGGASTVKHCCRQNWWASAVWWERGEIKGREGKASLSAREKLKGMKYSTIKLCGEFLIRRIKHLYAPRKESEMNKERERESLREREMINERQWREGWIVSV